MLVHRAASLHDRSRHHSHSLRRIRRSVGWREDAALPFAARRFASFARFFRAQHMRRNADRPCKIAPLRPAGQLILVVREIEKPAAAETRVFPGLLCYSLPEIETLGGDR